MGRVRLSTLNLLLGVNKPSGMTSHDVVAHIRHSTSERRVGHAGTLDPMATGVMVVGIGQATRLLGLLTLDTKSYIAHITFGTETSTDDSEGEVVREVSVPAEVVNEDYARIALMRLIGPQLQIPPAYSAISVNGVRAYKRARAGEDVELAPRNIEVFDVQLLGIDNKTATWCVAFTVSKGTYIRALARDLGRRIGSAAHLSALQRTASGAITLGQCAALDEITPKVARACALDPLRALDLQPYVLSKQALADVLNGRRIRVPEGVSGSVGVVIEGKLQALGIIDDGLLACKHVFPQGIEGVCL